MDSKRQDLLRLMAAAQVAASELQQDLESDISFRSQMVETSKQLTRTLQTPVDRAWEMFTHSIQPAVLQVALDAGWLHIINTNSANDHGVTADQLARHTASDAEVVKRLMRVLTSNAIIRESNTYEYAPTPFSKLFDLAEWANGLRHALRDYSITMAGMPEYFAQNSYQLDSVQHDMYEHVHGVPFLQRVREGGEVAMQFTSFMRAVRTGKAPWFNAYPVAEKLSQSSGIEILLVDVGGGSGHDLASFSSVKEELNLKGALVLQDVPAVIAHVASEYNDIMEIQAHDFFTPQKVIGARAYFLKHILHDWPNDACVQILARMRDAMDARYSRLLVNEIVLSDRQCRPWFAAFDVTMMAIVGGKERSEREWTELINKTGGLLIEKIWPFGSDNESIIEIVKVTK